MRLVWSIVTVSLLFIAPAAAADDLCGALSGAIQELDGYLDRMSQINLCLQGVPGPCESKEKAKKACAAWDALTDFHAANSCTDYMVGARPGLCGRL